MNYIIHEGEVRPASRSALRRVVAMEGRYARERYGLEWILVQAGSPADALAQAVAFDARLHPAQTEMELFVALYRSHAIDLR